MKRIIMALTLGSLLSSCARLPVSPEPIRHETSRNYTLNVRAQASVGDSVIRVKDYFVTHSFMTPTESFTFLPALNLSFVQGERYRVLGITERAGRTWTVVLHPRETNWAVLVADDGQINGEAFRMTSGFRGPFSIAPPSARMKSVTGDEKIEMSKPYTNYEIIYNGTDQKSLLFTYREFTPDGLARPSYYQSLTYDAKSSLIRFKKFRIEVHSATNEGIAYTVLEEDPGV